MADHPRNYLLQDPRKRDIFPTGWARIRRSIFNFVRWGGGYFVGNDFLVAFFHGLLSSLRTGRLRFMVFEAGEFAVYSNESSVPENQGPWILRKLLNCGFNLRQHWFKFITPSGIHSKSRGLGGAERLETWGSVVFRPTVQVGCPVLTMAEIVSAEGEITSPPISTLPRKSNLE